MSPALRVALTGFLATAVAFGPARAGYGLFLPQIRRDFGLSTESLGLIASGAQAAYLAALLAAAALTQAFGPRGSVTAGGLAAASGMGLVAAAPDAAWLTAGVALAATAAGFCWTPFNEAASRRVSERARGRVLAVVSTGTTLGLAAAGVAAWIAGVSELDWRASWVAFAGAGALAALAGLIALPGAPSPQERPAPPQEGGGLKGFARPAARPLFAAAAAFGTVSAMWIAFAVDRAEAAGGFAAPGPALYVALGLGGLVGLFAGEIERRVPAPTLCRLALGGIGLSAAAFAAAPGSPALILAAAALFGAGVMVVSAALAIWSLRVFPARASAGFTATLAVSAAGAVAGPAAAGLLAGRVGLGAAFAAAAALAALAAAGPACRRAARSASLRAQPKERS